jgi:hypothetical protein
MNRTFFEELINNSRFLQVLYDNLPDNVRKSPLYDEVKIYLEKYSDFNNISPDAAIDIYTGFITSYNKHCRQFNKTGKYPFENGEVKSSISREDYDIVLLLSVLFAPHRFRIMELINQKNEANKALFIGLGPGLEVYLTKKYISEIHTYDLSANKFLFSEFSDITINMELYSGQKQDYFDSIYLIELLEHLEDPYDLIKICYDSLRKNGKMFLTTATDLPQFDHLFNFKEDHLDFESKVEKIGLSILKKELVPHNYLTMEIKPLNHFYILEKV